MRSHWVHSEIGQRVLSYTLDPRPVWFWDEDGTRLLWRNLAARLFRTKAKKKRVKLLPDPVPLRGQINRLIRLGTHGRASLSRMRFQIGKKPVSSTCSCIPLIDDHLTGLLVISTDTIDPKLFSGEAYDLAASAQMFTPELDYVVVDDNHEVVAGAGVPQGDNEPPIISEIALDLLEQAATDQFDISARARMLVFEPGLLQDLADMGADALSASLDSSTVDAAPADGLLDQLDGDAPEAEHGQGHSPADSLYQEDDTAAEEVTTELDSRASPSEDRDESELPDDALESDDEALPHDLTELIDHLYQANTGLSESAERLTSIEADDMEDDLTADAEDERPSDQTDASQDAPKAPQLWIIRAKHKLTSAAEPPASANVALTDQSSGETSVAEPIKSEKASSQDRLTDDPSARYNFEELSRVLRERVGPDETAAAREAEDNDMAETRSTSSKPSSVSLDRSPASESEAAAQLNANGIPENAMDAPANPSRTPRQGTRSIAPARPGDVKKSDTSISGALVALSDETLVLNRLPLGILLFRDQELLFANRAMAELAGYKTSTELRQAGFDQIFPRADDGDGSVGPVTKLLRKDGTDIAVVARLQTTTWQGKSAYMLTAREDERQEPIELPDGFANGDEDQNDAALLDEDPQVAALDLELLTRLATAQKKGLLVLDNRGHVIDASAEAEALIGPSRELMLDRTLMEYIDADSRSAYFGLLAGTKQEADVHLFAGAAHCNIHFLRHPLAPGDDFQLIGLVAEVQNTEPPVGDTAEDTGAEADLLPLISREVRRPLATISGFNSLMVEEAYGPIGNDRYKEYIRDIQLATRRLERVVGELDDLSRYRDGTYELETAEIDLGDLLTVCISKIRNQANAQQVFVRSAIPDAQYLVEADQKLLSQTIMNLLASAVTLSPPGSNVIVSAIHEDNGDVSVHVRDNGSNQVDRSEKFAVFHHNGENSKDAGTTASSAVGLSLTRSLAKANAFGLTLDPLGEHGMMMALRIPGHRVQKTTQQR
ncbi:sensor histidine kinase [Maritalea mediterranea]|uniref:histidine kinase n=1 Tax=Maritalea mediterranea TaxID=2909667 RepID=A0ABS9E4F2_9HYPH|nr:HAMP domain-containing sensor histidine kinase [Maritalea mediterranea]MCF4097748.1 HAMP domain-containing histidine kinase [Maritalea mediterranea]